MSRDTTENKVQVIKTQLKHKVPGEGQGDWEKCKASVKEFTELSIEVEVLLNDLAKKVVALSDKAKEAYQQAPMKDTGYGISPLAMTRLSHALKRHLIKHGMRLDNIYINDLTKIQDFNDYVNEAGKWLLKFS